MGTLFTLRVLGQEFDIERAQAQALLRHASAVGTLTVLTRYRGERCYELGRTKEANHPAFVTVTGTLEMGV